MSEWERFAREDPHYCIWTEHGRGSEASNTAFFRSGEDLTAETLAYVEDVIPGWGIAVEIGAGVGRLAIPHSRRFEEVRAVDISPTMLRLLGQTAEERGITNIRTFLVDSGDWQQPPADYVYSFLVFQHIRSWDEIVRMLGRVASALAPGGIAHLQFDCRPATIPYRLSRYVPDRLLPERQRRGIGRVRRRESEIEGAVDAVGLEHVRARGYGTDMFAIVARRR